jgi:hypothetical protein
MGEINPLFQVHLLNEDGKNKAAIIAKLFDSFLSDLSDMTGTDGREIAIVRTKLEEAYFFAKKAMESNPANQA